MKAANDKKIGLFFLGLFLLSIFLLPNVSQAGRQKIVLNFDDNYYYARNGEKATLFLKRQLRRQYPGLRTRDMDLKKVVVVAKSKKGFGRAQLLVGNNISRAERIAGRPSRFNDNRRNSFDRVRFRNPSIDSRGKWQIHLRGNFVVRKVILVLDDQRYVANKRRYRYDNERQYRYNNDQWYSWNTHNYRQRWDFRWQW